MLLSEELYIWMNVIWVGFPSAEEVSMNSLIVYAGQCKSFFSEYSAYRKKV